MVHQRARAIRNEREFARVSIHCSCRIDKIKQTDPYQLYNLYDKQDSRLYDWNPHRLQQRLDTLLLTLKRCSGKVCTRPWEYLHPQGNVENLGDAMEHRFDAFYEAQPKVSFSGCALGQLLEFEGPLGPDVYAESES